MTGDDVAFLFAVAVAAGFWWLSYKLFLTREGLRSLLREWRESKVDSALLVVSFLGALHFFTWMATYGLVPHGLYGLGVACAALLGRGVVKWIKTGRLP